jgi:frataxin-like iron-binding protein CyaY
MSKILNKIAQILRFASELEEYDPDNGNKDKLAAFVQYYAKNHFNEFYFFPVSGEPAEAKTFNEVYPTAYKNAGTPWVDIKEFGKYAKYVVYHAGNPVTALYKSYSFAYKKLKEHYSDGFLEIYRGMGVDFDTFKDMAEGRHENLGTHWTLDKKMAKEEFATNNRIGSVGVLFTAKVSGEHIDIPRTIYLNIRFEDESEIRLAKQTPLTLINVEVPKIGGHSKYTHMDTIRWVEDLLLTTFWESTKYYA